MEKTQIYDSEFVSMDYSSELQRLYFCWKPKTEVMEDEQFKHEMNNFLSMFDTYRITSLQADLRTNGYVMSLEVQDWAEQEITVASYKKGLRHASYIMPEELLIQVSTQMALESAEEEGMHIKYVASPEEAEEWLAKVRSSLVG